VSGQYYGDQSKGPVIASGLPKQPVVAGPASVSGTTGKNEQRSSDNAILLKLRALAQVRISGCHLEGMTWIVGKPGDLVTFICLPDGSMVPFGTGKRR